VVLQRAAIPGADGYVRPGRVGARAGEAPKQRNPRLKNATMPVSVFVMRMLPIKKLNIPQKCRPDNNTTNALLAPPMRSRDVRSRVRAWWRGDSVSRRSKASCYTPDTSADGPSGLRFSRTHRTPGASRV
jgi:hypothetical protein